MLNSKDAICYCDNMTNETGRQEAGKSSNPLTEWFIDLKKIGVEPANYEDFLNKELSKFQHLEKMHADVGIPIPEYFTFDCRDFRDGSTNLSSFFEHSSTGKFSIRAEPKKDQANKLPTQRKHGISKEECYKFVESLDDEVDKYVIRIWEWDLPLYSGIMVVNHDGIFMEIAEGIHMQLSQGWLNKNTLMHAWMIFSDPHSASFNFDFKDNVVERLAYDIASFIKPGKPVSDYKTVNGYIIGSYDFMYYQSLGIRFNDHNDSKIFTDLALKSLPLSIEPNAASADITGLGACSGKVSGRVRVAKNVQDAMSLEKGEILVTEMTSPEYVPYMSYAKAIVTDYGGILCHAAIVSREINIPCIVGTVDATKRLKTGDEIYMDASKGFIRIIARSSS